MNGFFELRFGVDTEAPLKNRRYRPSVTTTKSLRFSIEVLPSGGVAGSPNQVEGCVMSCRSERTVSRMRTPWMFAGCMLNRTAALSPSGGPPGAGIDGFHALIGAVSVGSGSSTTAGVFPIIQSALLSGALGGDVGLGRS